MHFLHKDKSHEYLILGSREIALLIAFSSPDEKIPTINGASILLEGEELSAYAADGKSKSVRGVAPLVSDPNSVWERHTWLIPRSALIMASNVLSDGQEAYFPLRGARCALNGFERWTIETGGEDVKLDWHEFDQPIPANTQMGLPFDTIDGDVEDLDRGDPAVDVRYSSHSLKALTKLALAGLTPNLSLDIHSNGLLHAVTDGGTKWHAVLRPVSFEAADEAAPDEDDSLTDDGDLKLAPTEPKKRAPRRSSKVTPIGKGRGQRGRK